MDFSDLMKMLANPQAIQAKARELQQKTAALRETGQAGGGMVSVTLSGDMEMVDCHISPEVVDPDDVGMLQDLVRAAHHDACERIRASLQSQLAENAAGMNLPPGIFGNGNGDGFGSR